MFVHGDHHVVHGHVQLAGGGGDDADVGLVGHQPVDVGLLQAVGSQGLVDDAAEGVDRHLEHLVALHFHEGLAALEHLGMFRQAGGNGQQLLVLAIGVQMGGQDPRLVGRREHHGAGAVTEQYAGAAIGPVDDIGKGLGAHHQRVLRLAALDEHVGQAQCVDEAGAHGLHVEGRAAMHVEPCLQQTGGTGEDAVGRGGGHDDEIDVGRRDPGGIDGLTGRLFGQIARRLAFDDVTLLDAGSFGDPLVAGVDHALEFFVGEDAFRQMAAGTGDT